MRTIRSSRRTSRPSPGRLPLGNHATVFARCFSIRHFCLAYLGSMTPAEKRIKDQVDRWLISLDLHLQYVDLNDLAYNRAQPWPVHDRPTKLVLELAKQKTLELQGIFEARIAAGDVKFAEAMELMSFLANLVGSQHVQRFIPLADPAHHIPIPSKTNPPAAATKPAAVPPTPPRTDSAPTPPAQVQVTPANSSQHAAPARTPAADSATVEIVVEAPRTAPTTKTIAPPVKPIRAEDDDSTREMPRPMRAPHAAQKPVATSPPATAKQDSRKPAVRGPIHGKQTGSHKTQASNEQQQQIIADAVRLLNWGRQWHELAEAIARIADRPQIAEIRRILRNHRSDIQRRAAEPQS